MSEQSAAGSDAGMIPTRNSAREQDPYTESVQAALAEQTEPLRFLPAMPGLGEVTPQTVELAVNEAILAQKPAQEALSEAQEDDAQLLEEIRARYEA